MTTLPDARAPLPPDVARDAFDAIMDGRVADSDIARFLVEIANRSAAVVEIVAAATAMRRRMIPIMAPAGAIDVCGTGGDGRHSWNISTAVAIVVAACGVPVAKHGNRAASSRSGAADVLAALGVNLDVPIDTLERQLDELGIAFLFAANHHPAMARVAAVRKALGRKTIFNMLGPLANPAGVTRQLLGVGDPAWMEPMAHALADLGAISAMVIHGSDGLDELTVTGPSDTLTWNGSNFTRRRLTPADAGLSEHPADALVGGSPEQNAAALLALLGGAPGAYRDIVLLNSAAALIVGGVETDFIPATRRAAEALDQGRAMALLERWRTYA